MDTRAPRPLLLTLGLGTFTVSIAATTVVPVLAVLQRQFGVTAGDTAWLVTAYFLVASTATPILGRLGDMRGKRPVLIGTLGLFLAGSLLCAVAPNLPLQIAGRALQGFGGAVFPLAYGVVRDEFPRERVPNAIGFLAATPAVGGALGLPLGGFIAEHAPVAIIFVVQSALAAGALVAAWLTLPAPGDRSPGRVDVVGAVVFTAGFGLPLLAVSRGGTWGWGSPVTLSCLVAGAALLAGWAWLELRTTDPLVNIHTFVRRPVLLTNLTTAVAGFGLFGTFFLLPQLAQIPVSSGYGLGLAASTAGLLFVPNAVVNAATSAMSGQVIGRWGARAPLLVGCAIAVVAFVLLSVAHGGAWQLVAWSCVLAVGVGLSYPAMPNLILDAVAKHETSEASGVNTIMRNAGAAAGSAVAGTILAARTPAGGLPSESGFSTAFLVAALSGVLAIAIGVFIPRKR
ncbi:MFS transporter [Herbidospora mongoliensis]|uniref:MFS transporter n=1 Tax=Herbidospora mongoliensis TaxID=688067 RepID=UPI000832A040|nr:MFS transporter [Herbidospora mongoliensis]